MKKMAPYSIASLGGNVYKVTLALKGLPTHILLKFNDNLLTEGTVEN